MKFITLKRTSLQNVGIEGVLIILALVPIVFSYAVLKRFAPSELWLFTALGSSLSFLAAAYYILRKPDLGKIFAALASTGSVFSMLPVLIQSPEATLISGLAYISSIYVLWNFKPKRSFYNPSDNNERILQRTRGAGFTLSVVSFAAFFIFVSIDTLSSSCLLLGGFLVLSLNLAWFIKRTNSLISFGSILNFAAFFFLGAAFFYELVWVITVIIGLATWLFLPESTSYHRDPSDWWLPVLNHPARATFATFFILCLCGTFLLSLPVASAGLQISLLDAAFTSVSAVCITGLIVLDTPNDFSFTGQLFILLLIQLGGLGIMTIATVFMQILGRRVSLKQEKIIAGSLDSGGVGIAKSLLLIIKFTFIIEFLGAATLAFLFYNSGITAFDACWKGVFTSISAFCNAGFALQSASLIPYQTNPAIINTVALLIICGGIAPAVCLLVPAWVLGKPVPIAPRIALVTTFYLLVIGTFFFLAFEWNNSLSHLPLSAKFYNAWFQSVTLRTAGFNSVELEKILNPTFLVMLFMMFVGGSPGGTAGGVKTTTIGVIAITFWSCIIGEKDITIGNRKVTSNTVYKAIAIVTAGILILFLVILMLLITQSINAKSLIFETFSALGTVGLSIGATSCLDSMGKLIIMFTMFTGRIGPVTLFTLLSRDQLKDGSKMLDARINLT